MFETDHTFSQIRSSRSMYGFLALHGKRNLQPPDPPRNYLLTPPAIEHGGSQRLQPEKWKNPGRRNIVGVLARDSPDSAQQHLSFFQERLPRKWRPAIDIKILSLLDGTMNTATQPHVSHHPSSDLTGKTSVQPRRVKYANI
ncbi:predicted protein [Histoplasma capsulatum G186AR]|uniref:Uncharacterized protein n=1 Tax=Ajellomyces capsulatus (strain G186AR / H82 / ATCC MYA-2454 / RMSCC 2432) TaxID=447093 RepID=C0NL56_AJECG|nr:uncharacterized protein HCBG_03886 [Histoplasma capsulatum G186AR]EEH08597.1 predicted protein [Histoplasma capsulatum G186AR]